MILQLVRSHYRLGYTRVLLYIDAALVLLIGLDVLRFHRAGFSLTAALMSEIDIPEQVIDKMAVGNRAVIFGLFLLIVVPISTALLKVVGVPGFVSVNPAKRSWPVVLSHFVFCCFFVLAVYLTFRLELMSGWRQAANMYLPTFNSYFGTLVRSSVFGAIFSALLSLSTTAILGIFLYVLLGKGSSSQVRQYAVKLELADLAADLRPKTISYLSFQNHVSAAPSVAATDRYTQDILRGYYLKAETGSQQIEYMDRQLSECRSIILQELVEKANTSLQADGEIDISFYTGPGRAFEAAAKSLAGGITSCILLPYLSDSVRSLFEGLSRLMGCRLVNVALERKTYYKSWEHQEDEIVDALMSAKLPGGPTLVVATEVSYSTGLRTPLLRLITRIKSQLKDNSVRVIVDGTNAIGNHCRLRLGDIWDAYVFAPYRWLMVSERSGIVVTRKSVQIGSTDYGLLKDGSKRRDEEVRTIASIRSALEGIQVHKLEYFWSRCKQLRSAFESGMPRGFQIVGSQSGLDTTFILSCFPIEPTEWRAGPRELNDALPSVCEYASMVLVDPKQPWLRLSLPYHLDPRSLNKLNSFLDEKST